MLAQAQEIARPGQKFVMIDRRIEEVGRAGFERLETEGALLEDGDDDDRDVARPRAAYEIGG